jgi:hypothetical protein
MTKQTQWIAQKPMEKGKQATKEALHPENAANPQHLDLGKKAK